MDTHTNTRIKTSTAVSTALTSGAVASSFYYFHGNGKNLRHLSGYISNTFQSQGSKVKPFSPYNLLKDGEVDKALQNVHELEPEVHSEFYKAINHYKELKKSSSKTGLSEFIYKSLKKPKGEVKTKLQNNFGGIFKEYMQHGLPIRY